MKSRAFNVLMAIVVVGMSMSCQSEEFQTSEDGYQYKYIVKGDGKLPEEGEVVAYNMKYLNEKDSVIFQSTVGQPALVQCNAQQWDNGGPLFSAFKMIREGDSILIKIPTNVLFSESFRQPVPPDLDPEGEITFCIGAESIKTQGQLQAEALERSQEQMSTDIEIIDAYLEENNIAAQSTESGLRYVIEDEGNGDHPKQGDKVFVHYTGTLLDGTQFDSSIDRGEPLPFNIGQGEVIMGWDEGIALLRPGGKGTLYVPSPMAYGPRGAGGAIGPNSVLKFDVELVRIE